MFTSADSGCYPQANKLCQWCQSLCWLFLRRVSISRSATPFSPNTGSRSEIVGHCFFPLKRLYCMSIIILAWGTCKYRETEKELGVFIAASISGASSSSIAFFLCLLLGLQLCPMLMCQHCCCPVNCWSPVNSFKFTDIHNARHFFNDCMILWFNKTLWEH